MFDPTLLILLALAALGFVSHNTTVAISILVLIIVRVTPLNTALVCKLEIAGGDRGGDFCFVAGRARRYADEQPALAGGGSTGGHRAGRGALSRRSCGAADCGWPCLSVYREVVVRLAI